MKPLNVRMQMKNITALFSFLVIVLATQGSLAQIHMGHDNNDREDHAGLGPAPSYPGNSYGGLLVIYRMFNGVDHMLTIDPYEGVQVGYHMEGEAMRIFRYGGRDRLPLYRCVTRSGNDHFVSLRGDCEGQIVDYFMGYAQSFQSSYAHRAIYRCTTATDHLITLDMNECIRNGYKMESSLGFVP